MKKELFADNVQGEEANPEERQYLDLCRDILENGIKKGDRTGTGTFSVFGRQMRFSLTRDGKPVIPLLTTKKMGIKNIATELNWFIKGMTNIRYLIERKCHIWTEWALLNFIKSDEYDGPLDADFGRKAASDPEYQKLVDAEMKSFEERILSDEAFGDKWGELGPVYGKSWRAYKYWDEFTQEVSEVDQLQEAINLIKHNPDSRRILVVAWHPGYVKYQALPPCHYAFQFYVAEGKLSCEFSMRSVDVPLGNPYNIASYAILTHMMAKECGLEAGELIFSGGDVHIYSNQVEGIEEQLTREPRPFPTLWLNPEVTSIYDYDNTDAKVEGYDPHPAIYMPIAV